MPPDEERKPVHARAWAAPIAVLCCASCNWPASHARIIELYTAAACVPLAAKPKAYSADREWDALIPLRDGSTVVVRGAQIVSGQIEVFYPAASKQIVAANAGDYVYPSDVRADTQNDLLYVKADGLAGGIWRQTWLFKYDLRRQQLMERLQVRNDALPPECSVQSHRSPDSVP